jgi:hypothetical protein
MNVEKNETFHAQYTCSRRLTLCDRLNNVYAMCNFLICNILQPTMVFQTRDDNEHQRFSEHRQRFPVLFPVLIEQSFLPPEYLDLNVLK